MDPMVFVVSRKLIDRLEIIAVFDKYLDAKDAADEAYSLDDEVFFIEVMPYSLNKSIPFNHSMAIFSEPSPCYVVGPEYD